MPEHDKQVPVLPSFHAFCKTVEQTPNKNHMRTTSMPIRLPSQSEKDRLSLDVLLDAIELDQHMYEAYEQEWSKSAIRAGQRNAYRRRRSKSAPGVPRWRTPCSTNKARNVSVQQIAESIVQKHIESARKK
ncbi:hypothetical protein BJV82DRAFT_507618 [Fennellomyces sp. T-0311]|nr:hypothetical protein BJV82DRAFT_507618 [Fennellomyces sp. T-0311]